MGIPYLKLSLDAQAFRDPQPDADDHLAGSARPEDGHAAVCGGLEGQARPLGPGTLHKVVHGLGEAPVRGEERHGGGKAVGVDVAVLAHNVDGQLGAAYHQPGRSF